MTVTLKTKRQSSHAVRPSRPGQPKATKAIFLTPAHKQDRESKMTLSHAPKSARQPTRPPQTFEVCFINAAAAEDARRLSQDKNIPAPAPSKSKLSGEELFVSAEDLNERSRRSRNPNSIPAARLKLKIADEDPFDAKKTFPDFESAALHAAHWVNKCAKDDKGRHEWGFGISCNQQQTECTLSKLQQGNISSVDVNGEFSGHSHPLHAALVEAGLSDEDDKNLRLRRLKELSPKDFKSFYESTPIGEYRRHVLIDPNSSSAIVFAMQKDLKPPFYNYQNSRNYVTSMTNFINENRANGNIVINNFKLTDEGAELCNLTCANKDDKYFRGCRRLAGVLMCDDEYKAL